MLEVPGIHMEYINLYGILHRDPYVTHDFSDLHIARIAENIVGMDILRIEKIGSWLQWNGYCWKDKDNVTPILDKLADTIRLHISELYKEKNQSPNIFAEKFSQWCHIPAADTERLEKKFQALVEIEEGIYKKLSSVSCRNSIISLMGAHLSISTDDLNRNTDKVVFQNGYYDCQKGRFYSENERKHYSTFHVNTYWREVNEKSMQNVRAYVNDLGFDAETVEWLQRSLGYAVTGRGNEKRFWWFRGEGDTSKSTLINMVASCFNDYVINTTTEMWCERGTASAGHTEDIARLRGKRLIVADEFKKKVRLNGSLLKKMTAGSGKMSGSRKGEKTIEFELTGALFCASNYDCQVDQDDQAMSNRINTVTFSKVIDPEKKDTNFIENFLKTDDNKQALINWVLEGAHKYCVSGIGKDPSHIVASRTEFMQSQVSIKDQLDSILEINAGASGKRAVTLDAVMEALNNLQKATRQTTTFTRNEVAKAVTQRFGIERSPHNGFPGLALKNEYAPRKRRSFETALDWNGEYDGEETSYN